MKESIENTTTLMSDRYSLDISMYNDSFLAKTIGNRMTETSCKTIPDYLLWLDNNPSESILLMDSLNNSFSEFFRNPLTFMMMEQYILPSIFREKENNHSGEIRIWSAGCAAGQEPYSIAILSDEYKKNHPGSVSFRIFATDRSEKELHTARKGIYHHKTIQNCRLGLLNKYFSNSGEFYSIKENLKGIIDFSIFDLLEKDIASPPPSIFGDFDMIMCSNVLFYYKPETQKMILTKLFGALVEGGFLITGEAETSIIKSFRGFKQYTMPAAIFVKGGRGGF